jgi:large subunit ribosomal protein L23
MALFSSTPKKKVAKAAKAAVKKVAPATGTNRVGRHNYGGAAAHTGRTSEVLRAPWLSEKALIATERGVYVFEIPEVATKYDVAAAVLAVYKVVPLHVRVVNLPAKRKMMRSRRGIGVQSIRRKAYVTLQAGDTIQFA